MNLSIKSDYIITYQRGFWGFGVLGLGGWGVGGLRDLGFWEGLGERGDIG